MWGREIFKRKVKCDLVGNGHLNLNPGSIMVPLKSWEPNRRNWVEWVMEEWVDRVKN